MLLVFSKRIRTEGDVQMNDSGIDNDAVGWLSSVNANWMWHARRVL